MAWAVGTNNKNKIKKEIKMKLLKSLFGVVLATSLFTVAAMGANLSSVNVTLSAPQDAWTFSLAGAGVVGTTANTSFDGGLDLELGHTGKFILPLEAGVRQGVGLNYDGSANWELSTKAYVDWQLIKLGSLELDGGVNAGVAYGNTTLNWSFAPEATVRLWLTEKVNTFLRGEYTFDIKSTGISAEDKVRAVFGVQVRF